MKVEKVQMHIETECDLLRKATGLDVSDVSTKTMKRSISMLLLKFHYNRTFDSPLTST